MLTPEQIKAARERYGIPEPVNPNAPKTLDTFLSERAKAKEPTKPTFGSKVKDLVGDIKETGKDIIDTVKSRGDKQAEIMQAQAKGEQSKFSSFFQTATNLAGAVGEVAGKGVLGAGKAVLPQSAEDSIKNTVSSAAQKIMELPDVQDFLSKYEAIKKEDPEKARNIVALAEGGEFLLNFAGLKMAKDAVKPAVQTAKSVAEAGVQATREGVSAAADATLGAAKKTGAFMKEGFQPTPTYDKALGEVSRAKPDDLPNFERALSVVDGITDVKTSAELRQKFKDAIPELSRRVDEELMKDTGVYSLEDLKLVQPTKSGKEVKTDFVSRAIEGLQDLYTKLGDDVNKSEVDELAQRAREVGLTRKEVNDLARAYNVEYGNKAFTTTGDIKQGFNAQLYESTRKGLKDVARGGLGGDEAKALDRDLSALYDADRVMEKTVNAVNDMQQRIEAKGWVGKAVRTSFEALDLYSGGLLRAVRDTMLARGSAQKLQNVLELEARLQKNLEVINKALKAKTEKQAGEVLKGLENLELPTE